ncbi:MAG: hypothetical protein SGBAC_007993 [Bacillariaceae sp.]
MPKTDVPTTMGPDCKRAIVVDDNMRAALTIGDYVKVELDSIPGMNLPDGYVGLYPFTVKSGPADGSSTFKRIPVSAITTAHFNWQQSRVDCTVTGKSRGTPAAPKFALKDLFQYHIFQKLDGLVAVGRRYEGDTPVIEDGNTGPNAKAQYKEWCMYMPWLALGIASATNATYEQLRPVVIPLHVKTPERA